MEDSEKIYKLKLRVHHLAKKVIELENEIKKRDSLKKSSFNINSREKKQEIIESLEYLKSKEVKTKQDQISIYTLEVVLKGLK
jgi:hypothetical protein